MNYEDRDPGHPEFANALHGRDNHLDLYPGRPSVIDLPVTRHEAVLWIDTDLEIEGLPDHHATEHAWPRQLFGWREVLQFPGAPEDLVEQRRLGWEARIDMPPEDSPEVRLGCAERRVAARDHAQFLSCHPSDSRHSITGQDADFIVQRQLSAGIAFIAVERPVSRPLQ
ncbi:hypothetical protein [Leptolyngbya sp. 7M]|uniref:hypothetical protein n=1 Tax=Leptolyngbya sp. 7M TaxID=2812896 RepID=UPI001B8A9D08|nr:hypothetical protein [Leptolyngbya sp. 7M]QYO64193.1 hypothetical protein JVX88_31355 [Leptolyngbya sp. 7M]